MLDIQNWRHFFLRLIIVSVAGSALIACGGGSSSSSVDEPDDDVDTPVDTDDNLPVDTDKFLANALAELVTEEDCTLSDGTETTCYRITIVGFPSDQITVGPFCPETTMATADDAGIWFDGGGDIYDVDGDFILGLADLYGDDNWLLYDEITGDVNVTDTQVSCEAAARPDVAEEYQNFCVECKVEYIEGGQPTSSYLIPTTPVALATSESTGNGEVGISFNGVKLDAPAPIDAILGAYTIAAFDDCAGHINTAVGYHYHGANGCSEGEAETDGHAAAFAYALDGYAIYSMLDPEGNEATGLDECRGHSDDIRGYHYHAASAAENMFIGCFNGATAQ